MRRVFKEQGRTGARGEAFCSGALQFTLIRSDFDLIYLLLAPYILRSVRE